MATTRDLEGPTGNGRAPWPGLLSLEALLLAGPLVAALALAGTLIAFGR